MGGGVPSQSSRSVGSSLLRPRAINAVRVDLDGRAGLDAETMLRHVVPPGCMAQTQVRSVRWAQSKSVQCRACGRLPGCVKVGQSSCATLRGF